MSGKKTGLFLSPISEPIVNQVMENYGYKAMSNAINFIIQEYDRLIKEDRKEVVETKEEIEESKTDFSSWFVAEDK